MPKHSFSLRFRSSYGEARLRYPLFPGSPASSFDTLRVRAGQADTFYGYYTLHFLQDGEIEGMLSVHGSTGDVWYHSWHGDFVTTAEGHG